MECPNKAYGDNGVMIFSDCGVNIDPDAEQLANIALGAADSARSLAGMEPRVAMLSFSTKGSAKHDNVTKVQEATRIAKEMAPDLMLDGELQLVGVHDVEIQHVTARLGRDELVRGLARPRAGPRDRGLPVTGLPAAVPAPRIVEGEVLRLAAKDDGRHDQGFSQIDLLCRDLEVGAPLS
jgi:hypothetical protein